MAEQTVFRQVLSLGLNCRAKAQIQRAFGREATRRHIFDWQTTPASALLAYFRNDFRGAFERADLVIVAGVVNNRKFGTKHPHEFPKNMTDEVLDELYPAARALHDGWCDLLRQAVNNRHSTLFVLSAAISEADKQALAALIANRRRRKRVLILDAPVGDLPPDEGDGHSWMGDLDLWERHLSPFRIVPPLATRMRYQFHRFRKNIRYALPRPFQGKRARQDAGAQ